MSRRLTACAVGAVCIGLVVAQDVVPLAGLFHTWQYATALALGAFVLIGYLNGARKGEDGLAGKRLALAVAGALVVTLAGLASGLLGPDTETVSHAPGTVAPIPDLRAAAFFTQVDAATLAAGEAHVTVRRPNKPELDVAPNGRRFLGDSVLVLEPQEAAFVEARDARGDRLTITQPTNPSFLSPVLLFPQTQVIAGKNLPLDSFAVPAAQRLVKAIYLPASMTASMRIGPDAAGKPAILYAVDDEQGRSLGIAAAPSGAEVAIGGLRLRAILGTYPRLAVASAPAPLALLAGLALVVAGLVWTALDAFPRAAVPLKNPSSS